MNRSVFRRLSTAVAGPVLAAGVLLGALSVGAPATAGAQPMDNQCATMTMTDGQSGPNPAALTRAGQVNVAAGPGASDGSMTANCGPASHG